MHVTTRWADLAGLRRPVAVALALLLLAGGAAPARAEGERMFDPRFREGAPSDALVPGPPRLSRGHMSAYVDLLEAAFDVAVAAQEEQALRDALETEFQSATTLEREAFLGLVDPIVALREKGRQGDRTAVLEGLRRFRAAIDTRIAAAPGRASHRLVTRLLARRHEVLWVGEPAVKGVSVDAYLELTAFMAGLARNEAVPLTPGQVSALRDYLGPDLRLLERGIRQRLAGAHRLWLLVKARWDQGGDAQRLLLRWEALALLARLNGRPPPAELESGGELEANAREAEKLAAVQPPFEAVTALARNPAALFDALRRGLDLPAEAPEFTFLLR